MEGDDVRRTIVLVLAATLLLGFGGQGPAHSGRCRGVPTPTAFGHYRCTQAGWIRVAPIPGPVGHGG